MFVSSLKQVSFRNLQLANAVHRTIVTAARPTYQHTTLTSFRASPSFSSLRVFSSASSSLDTFLTKLKNSEEIAFKDSIEVIDNTYEIEAVRFQVGEVVNEAGI